uniref:F-box domain-containing protein n=1 Tax=Oryza punctata TaxID=4537 RepID=A0A0E0M755_ORYPU
MAAANLLPDDVMEEILRRVAPSPRSLAACRVVCKAWRAVVDTRCPPPHPDLLPLSLAGIFFTTFYYPLEDFPGFFARRGCHHRARISPKLDYLDDAPIDYLEAGDHCNGLLLMCEYVVNPATRRWARLPPTPEWSGLVGLETTTTNWWGYEYLVFDPTMSPHYEVSPSPNPMVWLLHEPHGDQMEYWMLIHDANLDEIMADFRWNPDHQALIRPWVQHDIRRFSKKREEISSQDIDESGGGWDSEDDSIVYTEDMVGWGRNEFTCILGFHPFREIIFLYEPREEVRAYHLHNSKVEVLGTIDLFEFPDIIGRSFPYTPCWIGDLS